MQQLIEQQILEAYESMIECIKSDKLDMASKYQQIINELKQQLESINGQAFYYAFKCTFKPF